MANTVYENIDNIIKIEIFDRVEWPVVHKPAREYKVIDKKKRWWRSEVSHMEQKEESWVAVNPNGHYYRDPDTMTLTNIDDCDHLDIPSSRTKIGNGKVYVDPHLYVSYAIGKRLIHHCYYFLTWDDAKKAADNISLKSNCNLYII
jgi:hypothetical protein